MKWPLEIDERDTALESQLDKMFANTVRMGDDKDHARRVARHLLQKGWADEPDLPVIIGEHSKRVISDLLADHGRWERVPTLEALMHIKTAAGAYLAHRQAGMSIRSAEHQVCRNYKITRALLRQVLRKWTITPGMIYKVGYLLPRKTTRRKGAP